MKVNLWLAMFPDKPTEKDIQGKINYSLIGEANRNKEFDLKTFQKCIVNGAVWTPAVLNTPIKSDPYNNIDYIVNEQEWEAMGKNKQYKIKCFEINKQIYRRMAICWTQQEIFALDFDSGITEKEILKRCKDLDIKPFWLYNSYSSTPSKHKFRLLFKFEQPITDYRIAQFIQNGLMTMFPESDKQCSDLCRYFFGTNKQKYSIYKFDHPEFTLNIEDFCKGLFNYFKQKDTIHFSRNIKMFAANNQMLLDSNNCILIDKNPIENLEVENLDVAFQHNYYIPFTCKEMDLKYNGYTKVSVSQKGQIKTSYLRKEANYTEYQIDLDELKDKCQLVDEAYKANYELGHAEYFKLMQLFSHIHGGDIEFEEIINNNYETNKNNYDVYNPESLYNEYTYVKLNGYNLPLCDGDCENKKCPYSGNCVHGKTPLTNFNVKGSEIDCLNTKEYTETIEKSYEILKDEMTRLYNSDHDITVINAPTGIGKTEILLDIVNVGDIIALPTHDLIADVYTRLVNKGKSALIATERPRLADLNDENYYQYYLQRNMTKTAMIHWKNKVKQYSEKTTKTDAEQKCIDWVLEQKQLFECSDKIILCTHHKLPVILKKNDNIKNVFIDEDPIQNIILTSSAIEYKDLKEFVDSLSFEVGIEQKLLDKVESYFKDINKKIRNTANVFRSEINVDLTEDERKYLYDFFNENYTLFRSPVYELFDDEEDDSVFLGKIIVPEYTTTKKGKSTIDKLHIVKHNPLQKKNTIILSASIPKLIAQKLNWEYINIPFNYKNENIKLYFNDTYSASALERMIKNGKNSTELNFIKNIIDDTPVITFKKFKDKLKNLGFNIVDEMHFGKCEGFDILKGQNIAILGTFHSNPIAYELLAAALNIDLSYKTMKNQRVNKNDHIFTFYCYTNEDLREIQLYKIESELLQAVGRARTYRTDAEVYVFSNYPIKGVKIMK